MDVLGRKDLSRFKKKNWKEQDDSEIMKNRNNGIIIANKVSLRTGWERQREVPGLEKSEPTSTLKQKTQEKERMDMRFSPYVTWHKVDVSRLLSPSHLLRMREEAMRTDVQCKSRKLEVADCFLN